MSCRRGPGQQPEVITGELTIAIGRRATVMISTPTKTPSDQASHAIDEYASRIERIIDRSEVNPDTIAIRTRPGTDAGGLHLAARVRLCSCPEPVGPSLRHRRAAAVAGS